VSQAAKAGGSLRKEFQDGDPCGVTQRFSNSRRAFDGRIVKVERSRGRHDMVVSLNDSIVNIRLFICNSIDCQVSIPICMLFLQADGY
jgi:hypothetical protein